MMTTINLQNHTLDYINQGNYAEAINFYEQAIIKEPDIKSYYCHLGLLLLLAGQEAEAQMTWMFPLAEAEAAEIDLYTNELIQILQTEAERREKLAEYSLAWVIRQHLREINPDYLNNLLKLIELSIKLEKLSGDELTEWGIIKILLTEKVTDSNTKLLLQVLDKLLEEKPLHPISLKLAETCLPFFSSFEDCLCRILPAAMKMGHTLKHPALAAAFLELCLRLDTDNLEILKHLAAFYQDGGNYSQGIKTAKLCYSLSQTLPDQIFALHLVLRGLLTAGGYSQEVNSTSKQLVLLLQEFIKAQPLVLEEIEALRLITPSFTIPHLQDNPNIFREIHNQIANIFQVSIQEVAADNIKHYSQKQNCSRLVKATKPLRIGYLSYALRQHSVGWLARWLFQHHNRQNFDIYTYFVNYKTVDDWLQEWFVSQSTHARKLGTDALEIAEKVCDDEIDILIDLDSITLDISCEVMALKPAPIQVTWLGWDASGIPAIDYFIADPYVLPDSAQNYYTEKIWRLPHTYIAVDGFEVSVPTLRRKELGIPADAVVYLSAQRGYKRNPETTKWQMKIIKEVPNSYLLIKGLAEEESIKRFFYQIAEEENVDCTQLRFLPDVVSESVHRANLGIADVVLDTYPYNGATTTLETLWMGIPLVTRVGEQFAARNSYTMMINAGITEGIAWTDEEYIEWGVRLGKDAGLRQQVAWKLRQSRQTAPLWNAKQFTHDMENAYQQMWQRYIEG